MWFFISFPDSPSVSDLPVRLKQTEASQRQHLAVGEYRMVVRQHEIALKRPGTTGSGSGQLLGWPLQHIRRFKLENGAGEYGKITLEANS